MKNNPSKSKRYIGGVCVKLGKKYKMKPITVRIIFIVSTIVLQIIPIAFYIISWIFNSQNFAKINDKKERNRYQLTGLVLGMLVGTFLGAIIIPLIYGHSMDL